MGRIIRNDVGSTGKVTPIRMRISRRKGVITLVHLNLEETVECKEGSDGVFCRIVVDVDGICRRSGSKICWIRGRQLPRLTRWKEGN